MVSVISVFDSVIFVQVYLAAGAVYSLEGALSDLEDCARSISSSTTETELAFLEDQVATAAAQVQQSELQVRAYYVTMLTGPKCAIDTVSDSSSVNLEVYLLSADLRY